MYVVTLSIKACVEMAMHCVLCLMLSLSISEVKACHASMVQMLCYVDMVDPVVFAAFMQMHTDTQTQCSAYMPLTPPREKALKSPVL